MIFATIEQLKEKAFEIKEPVKVIFPLWGDIIDTIIPERNPKLAKGFAVNGNRISFVAEDLVLRVIPYMDGIVELLKKNGYEHKSLYVPFSNGDGYPLEQYQKWNDLLMLAKA